MSTGWVVVMGGGDLLQLQLAPRHTELDIKAIHQLFPRHPDLLGEREGPGIDSRKFHSQVDSLTCSEPAPVTTRTLVLLFASSSLHHHFTLLVFWLLKKSILPPSCSRAESEWVSACRWRWQCARHLASSPPSRHCSRLLVVHH